MEKLERIQFIQRKTWEQTVLDSIFPSHNSVFFGIKKIYDKLWPLFGMRIYTHCQLQDWEPGLSQTKIGRKVTVCGIFALEQNLFDCFLFHFVLLWHPDVV